MIGKPRENEIPEYYRRYTGLVQSDDLLAALEASLANSLEAFGGMRREKEDFRYAPGKWTTKQVLSHINDCERVFGYRALRFARGDGTPLPSIDENTYAENDNSAGRHLYQIIDEFRAVRSSTVELFRSFSPELLDRQGTANNTLFSVRALGWIIAGHCVHHTKILRERYL
jgi:hypothetical protein